MSATHSLPPEGASGADGPYAKEFSAWWAGYPRKVDKHRAFNAYRARRRAGLSAEALLAARDHYAGAVQDRPVDKIRHAATFLGPDVEEWVHGPPEGAPPPDEPAAWRVLREDLAAFHEQEVPHDP